MSKFKTGQVVKWNSEAGMVRGTIIAVRTAPFKIRGKNNKLYTRHATKDNPQYAIKSDKSDHIAYHFGGVLTRV